MSSTDNTTLYDPSVTYVYSKVFCLADAYYAHIVFAYLVMIAGFGCLFTRFLPRMKFLHVWFGRTYINAMLWCMGTSLLITNTGLPVAVLVSFIWVGAGLTIGWAVINIYQQQMQAAATKSVGEKLKVAGAVPVDLGKMIAEEKGIIADSRTFWQRILSLKALHGALMVTSWVNIIGRVFVTPLTNDFECYTYPYYKPIDTNQFQGAGLAPQPVPENNPNYMKLPWAKMGIVAWGVALSVGPLVGSYVIGIIWVAIANYIHKRKAAKEASVAAVQPVNEDAAAETVAKPVKAAEAS
ncbi:hypothetical protein DFJ74DRAFT_667515 [Hyaloraphidium curvatum]|nr:hypothetical protein DFJ74DRAFT_667515 [Hyaloraphidium curvatum]